MLHESKTKASIDISTARHTEKWRPICDGCDKRTRANQYSMAPPTDHPPPSTPLSGTRESIQFPQNPLAAINGHRFLPKITISLQNIFHVFQAEVAFIDRHPQPSGGSFSDGKKQTAKKRKRQKSIASNNTPKTDTIYFVASLSVADSFIRIRSIIDAVGSYPSDPPPPATGTRTQHGPQRIIYYQRAASGARLGFPPFS